MKTFKDYEKFALSTAIHPEDPLSSLSYLALGLVGESGEVAEKIKKIIRDDGGKISPEKSAEIRKELGDVLWYLTNLSNRCGFTLLDTACTNEAKLMSRKKRGVLKGNGDNR